ncbi:MAG: ribosome maturation factor RimP [Acidimicrobiia bacterium]|nr:ribosome maturation factor RimP [Acidimicrobiia bacterium]
MTDRVTALTAELEPIVASLDLSIYDITLAGGERPTLVVLVNRAGGVDLDTIETATRTISAALDAIDPVRGRYLLEVSSPGLERPLRTPEHFRSAVGEDLTLKARNDEGHLERIRGTLVACDDATITVTTDAGDRTLALDVVEQARTVFVWGPAPKPGKGSRPGRKKEVAA